RYHDAVLRDDAARQNGRLLFRWWWSEARAAAVGVRLVLLGPFLRPELGIDLFELCRRLLTSHGLRHRHCADTDHAAAPDAPHASVDLLPLLGPRGHLQGGRVSFAHDLGAGD